MNTQRRTYFAILMTLWATTALGMQHPNFTDNNPFEDFNSEEINCWNLNPENLNPQNFNPQNLNPQNLNPQNFNPQNFNPQNFNPQNLNPQNLNPRIDTIDSLVKLKAGSFDEQWRYKKETINEKICTNIIGKNVWFMIFKYLLPKDINNFSMSCKDGFFLKRYHRPLQINTDYSPFKTPKIAIEQLIESYPNLKELIIIKPTPKYLEEIGKNQKNKTEQESKLEHICLTFLNQDTTALEKLNKLPLTLKSLTIRFPKYVYTSQIISIKAQHIQDMPKNLEGLHVINAQTPGVGVLNEISSRFVNLKHLSLPAARIFHGTLGKLLSKNIFKTIETLNFLEYYFSDEGLKMINGKNFPKLRKLIFSSSFMDYKAHVKCDTEKQVTTDGLVKFWESNPLLTTLTIVNHGYQKYTKKENPIMPINTLKQIQEEAKRHRVTFNLSCFPDQIKLCENCLDHYSPKPNVTNEKRKNSETSTKNKKINKRKKK